MPKKRSMSETFLKFVEENDMKWEGKLVDDESLLFNPMENEKEGKKYFEDLKNIQMMIYEISKK